MSARWWTAGRWLHHSLAIVLLSLAGWHAGRFAWAEVKAHLAQHLARRAWQATRAGATSPVRPWPRADTQPVARLTVPGKDVDVVVLAGAGGHTLALGPGHLSGTPLPGLPGNSVIAGHRDTHFAFLRRLRTGEAVVVERPDGLRVRYRVAATAVVGRRATFPLAETADTRLTLVTCYPFDGLDPDSRLRYVVTALGDTPNRPAPASQRASAKVSDRAYTSVRPRSRRTSGEPSGPSPLHTP